MTRRAPPCGARHSPRGTKCDWRVRGLGRCGGRRVDVFDYDLDKGPTGRRCLVDMSAEDGHPDGLTVDSEDGVWVAIASREGLEPEDDPLAGSLFEAEAGVAGQPVREFAG